MVSDACRDTINLVESNMNETLGRTSKLIRALSKNMSPKRESKTSHLTHLLWMCLAQIVCSNVPRSSTIMLQLEMLCAVTVLDRFTDTSTLDAAPAVHV